MAPVRQGRLLGSKALGAKPPARREVIALQPEHRKGTEHARTVFVTTPATLTAGDFVRIEPGQTVGYLMDADPIESAKGARLTNAYLEVSMPAEAGKAVDGMAFSGSRELVSGPIEMSYAEESGRVSEQARGLCALVHVDPASARVRFREAFASASPDAVREVMEAVDLAFRDPVAERRWGAYETLCELREPRLEDALVGFLARFGPRIKQEKVMIGGIVKYARCLPIERRAAFLARVAAAIEHDGRSLHNLASEFTVSLEEGERAFALRIFRALHERGDRRPDVLCWMAAELARGPDVAARDRARALEFADEACKADPANLLFRYTRASISGDKDAMDEALSSVSAPSHLNNMAWDLATRNPPGSLASQAALRLARKAVETTRPADPSLAYRLDTLAVCHAALGDFEEALKLEQKAHAGLPNDDDERGNYAERIARFTALAKGEASDRPSTVLGDPPLKSSAARKALLDRLQIERDPLIRAGLARLLKGCFGAVAPEPSSP